MFEDDLIEEEVVEPVKTNQTYISNPDIPW